jgi:type III restriction enzyme
MKFRFKIQTYQTEAVKAVVDCFDGQPLQTGLGYRIDPGRVATGQQARLEMDSGFKNSDLLLPAEAILKNLQAVQVRQNLPVSESLKQTKVSPVNLDVEMETGTGKTYCYIKTIFELNKRYGWCKFIVVVPSIAIREGVAQSLADTAEHFLESYGKRVRSFIYDSKALHNLESFSSNTVHLARFVAFCMSQGQEATIGAYGCGTSSGYEDHGLHQSWRHQQNLS